MHVLRDKQWRHLPLPLYPWFPGGLSGPPVLAAAWKACLVPPPAPLLPDHVHLHAPQGTAGLTSTVCQPLQAEDIIAK